MFKSLTAFMLISAVALLVNCGGGAGAGGQNVNVPGIRNPVNAETLGKPFPEDELTKSETKRLGDVRITYRQYAIASVVGTSGARPTDRKEALVNLSHSAYDKASNDKLKAKEFFISDSVALQLLNAFDSAGYFNVKSSNVRRVPAGRTIESYAKSFRNIYKWIAVEKGGHTYIIRRFAQEKLTAAELKWGLTFNECEMAIFRATNNKRPKATVRELSPDDLRRRQNEARRRRNAANNGRR